MKLFLVLLKIQYHYKKKQNNRKGELSIKKSKTQNTNYRRDKLMANAKRKHRIKNMNFQLQHRRIEQPSTKTDKYELIEKVKDEILQRTTRGGVRPQHI